SGFEEIRPVLCHAAGRPAALLAKVRPAAHAGPPFAVRNRRAGASGVAGLFRKGPRRRRREVRLPAATPRRIQGFPPAFFHLDGEQGLRRPLSLNFRKLPLPYFAPAAGTYASGKPNSRMT